MSPATRRLRGMPPGRAGRLWLQHRLSTAERGGELLDHKLRILRAEHQSLELLEQRTRASWESAAREAATWSTRAGVVGGRRANRLAVPVAPATVEVTWTDLMGVRLPASAVLRVPPPDPDDLPTPTAQRLSADRHRAALDAAVQHAVTEAALRAVTAEMQVTRRRVRAIEERWLPRLRAALAELGQELEEQEHEEGVRLRWASGRRGHAAPAGGRRGG